MSPIRLPGTWKVATKTTALSRRLIPLGESLMIARTSPLWNAVIDGFGNHDPGKGRIAGMRPIWDTLHPGRPWAVKYPARPEAPDAISLGVVEHLRARYQV